MWRAYTPQGFLAYSFAETVAARHVENVVRLIGGLLYLSGLFIMIYNVWRTIALPSVERAPVPSQLPIPSPALAAAE